MTETTTNTEVTAADGTNEDVLPGEPESTVRPDIDDLPGADRQDDDEMFSRAYVEKLRNESAKYRVRAQRTTELEHRLHRALVAATGRLADPEDLEFNEDHLESEDALTEALDDLLARKPHLAPRRPRGDVGQGATASPGNVNLAELLRGLAG